MSETIYLDYNATTPVCKEAMDAALRAMQEAWGNPSCGHGLGQLAKEALETARSQVAQLIGAKPSRVLFTSGGTESNNLAILGLLRRHVQDGGGKGHLLTSAIEHPSVLQVFRALEKEGWRVTYLSPGPDGTISPAAFEAAIQQETVLASIMLANNETGAIQPVAEMARSTRAKGVVLHTDACQALGKIPVDITELGVDMLSIAGHKLHAPKGTGALFVAEGISLAPILHGAGQEGGLRPGTEPVPMASALGAACRLAGSILEKEAKRQSDLRERLFHLLTQGFPGIVRHGRPETSLPNTLFVSFDGLEGSEILKGAPEVLASTGAACHDRCESPSHVLAAMGVDPRTARGSIRLSLGRNTTEEDIDRAAAALISSAKALTKAKRKGMAP